MDAPDTAAPGAAPPDTEAPGLGATTASDSMAANAVSDAGPVDPRARERAEARARERAARNAEARDLGQRIVHELSERQAEEIVLMDVAEVSGFTDYFVIASATSSRQFEALSEAVERAAGDRTHRREGGGGGGWQLFDFSDLVVHIFGREERAYYNLEGLWSAGRQILRVE